MSFIQVYILTSLIVVIKAVVDYYRWPFKNHWIGFIIVAILVGWLCYEYRVIYPIFMYNMLFNPLLNTLRGLDLFYIGDTAWTDRLLKELFLDWAGEIWVIANFALVVATVLVKF